uniref:Uncharacterized protein n=1 Tax=Anguilla anguilla TaxID=7936 RepID=A0A0E9TAV0_ANGAN
MTLCTPLSTCPREQKPVMPHLLLT